MTPPNKSHFTKRKAKEREGKVLRVFEM